MRFSLSLLLASCLLALPARAYNPPVDKAGPLTVRIEGPEKVTETGKPLAVRVVVENGESAAVEGTLELGLIDQWRANPAEPVPFAVGPDATVAYDFTVTAGAGTYSGHYPIHAYARFTSDDKPLVAHPILILQTELPATPRPPLPLAWKPYKLPENGRLALWRTPMMRTVVQIFGRDPLTTPVGWQGEEADSKGGMHVRDETLEDRARASLSIHPPWFDGLAGTLAVEYPIELPQSTSIRLAFGNGMTPTGESDGVTFRVRVTPLDAPQGQLGQIVFERHATPKTWLEGEADLSRFAGQAVRIQLESHPGPKNNTGWDHCYWAEPTLTAGVPVERPVFPPRDNSGSRVLGSIARSYRRQTVEGAAIGEESAPDAHALASVATYEVRLWPGSRGLLDAVVGFSDGDQRLCFQGFEIRVQGGRIDDDLSPMLLEKVTVESGAADPAYEVRHHFQGPFGSFDVVGRLAVEDGVLRTAFRLENGPAPKPWFHVRLEDVAAGPWSHEASQVYAGAGNVVRRPGPFRLGFDGHRCATSFVGLDFDGTFSLVQGCDSPPIAFEVRPERKHYSLHGAHETTLTFIPTDNVWSGARAWRDVNHLRAGGGVPGAAGRFVFDLWGGKYGESADDLQKAFRYGLTDSMVVWHNWQRWGYDYRLPNIYPPNPRYGTTDEMRRLVDVCKQAGVPIAPHDNYIDFYPDADGFSYEQVIAFHADGRPVEAWLNEGRDARSYRYRADKIEPFLKSNVELIRQGLKPDAFFIDVWSSARPYDYWTSDGQFFSAVYTRDVWGKLFSWIRDELGDNAPQISESGHDQLIGHLDGAQTNHLRVGTPGPGPRGWTVWDWKCEDAERVPWFDAAHHDRFILHGAGYSSRYEGGLPTKLHGIYSDDYMATEVLTGHPAMVPRPFNRDVVRKYWLLGRVMRALAMRTIESVEFDGDDLHRQYVRWSGGAEVWVNRGSTDWTVAGVTLPEFGFLARVPVDGSREGEAPAEPRTASSREGHSAQQELRPPALTEAGVVEASITRRDGVIVEMARSPEEVYVNGRQLTESRLPIRMTMEKLTYRGQRNFELSLAWDAAAPIPAGWAPFLHFCDPQGEIIFQAHHQPGSYPADKAGKFQAVGRGTIPDNLPLGETYELVFGVFNQASGQRLTLIGPDVGDQRIRLGKIRLDGQDGRLSDLTWIDHVPEADPYLTRWNLDERPIDFGPAVTVGGARLSPDGGGLLVTPLPGERWPKFVVDINVAKLPWKLGPLGQVEVIDEQGQVSDRRAVAVKDGVITLHCDPGPFAYRIVE